MSDKQFIGNVKEIETKFGKMIKIGINETDFVKHLKNGWVNMILKQNKEGKYYLEVDTWEKPGTPFKPTTPEPVETHDPGDLPF